MSDHIQDAVQNAVEKQHLQAGDTVDAKAAMHMMDDVYKQLQKDQKLFTGDKQVPSAYMKVAAGEMEKALKDYGIMDIEFVDSKADNKAGKGDQIKIQEDVTGPWNPTTTFNLGDRPAVAGTEQPLNVTPIWKEQLKQYSKDPQQVEVKGYNNK